MSTIIDVKRSWSLATSSLSVTGRSAFEVYTVLFDAPDDNLEVDARSATGVPRVQVDTHPADNFLVATNATTKMLSPVLVEVSIDYGTPAVAGFRTIVGDTGESYIDWSPQVRWSTIESEDLVDHDADGLPIVNSAGDMITIPQKFNDPVYRLSRNIATFDPDLISPYMYRGGAISSTAFLGAPAGQAKIVHLEAEEVYFGASKYVHISVAVAFRQPVNDAGLTTAQKSEYAWYRRHANRGYRVKVGEKMFRAQVDPADDGIKTDSPTPEPVLLKADKTRETNPANTVWIYTKPSLVLDFAGLGVFI